MTVSVTRPVTMVHGKRKAAVLESHKAEFKRRYGADLTVLYSNTGKRVETTDRYWSEFSAPRKQVANFSKALKRLGFKPIAGEWEE